MMKKVYVVVLGIFFLINLLGASFAGLIGVSIDNDFVLDTDRYYTHGTRLIYLDDTVLTLFCMKYFADKFPDKEKGGWVSLAQYMYTPSDITIPELIINDRPYAGWLFLGMGLSARNDDEMDFLEFDIGVIGPSAKCEYTQKLVHEWTESPEPMGWKNQLKNELGVNIVYQKKYRFRYENYFDFIPHAGGSVGNVFTFVNGGAMARVGYNLPDDFGFLKMEPTSRAVGAKGVLGNFSCYVYGETDTRGIFRNIFLDGNTFQDSHSVEKENWVLDASTGIGIRCSIIELLYGVTVRSKEFREQENYNKFATMAVVFRF